jgi:SAM-dependent methyltransferase
MDEDKSLEITCKICGAKNWTVLYSGPVRVGKFGQVTDKPQTIWKCGQCEVGFLDSPGIDYESGNYRKMVDDDDTVEHFYKSHDVEQLEKIKVIGTGTIRDGVIADVGCGAGSFLDLVKGYSSTTIGIEPQRGYHSALIAKGHHVYDYCADVPNEWWGKVDLAVCFSVIEHLDDPVDFLLQVRKLLRTDGQLLVSTPNLNDWLLGLLPDVYPSFFYRVVHQWYFGESSLIHLARIAGFSKVLVTYVHRFDLSNFLLWLRDKRPTGSGKIQVSPSLNAHFCRSLEEAGRADYIYAWLGP